LIRHKEWNEQQHRVPKVPFNKDLNRNTPSRAVLDGVLRVWGDAFKSYDVTKSCIGCIELVLFVFCFFLFRFFAQSALSLSAVDKSKS